MEMLILLENKVFESANNKSLKIPQVNFSTIGVVS